MTVAQKALIQPAAELEDRTFTDHMIASVLGAAKRTMEAHETIVLGAADSRAFVESMLEQPPINDRLKDSVRRHRELTGA